MAAVIEQRPSPQSSTFLNRLPRVALKAFCARWHVSYLAFFGSVLRSDFGPDSDIDIIMDFDPGHVPGIEFVTLCEELTAILGHRVDVLTRTGLEAAPESSLKRRIQKSAQPIYER